MKSKASPWEDKYRFPGCTTCRAIEDREDYSRRFSPQMWVPTINLISLRTRDLDHDDENKGGCSRVEFGSGLKFGVENFDPAFLPKFADSASPHSTIASIGARPKKSLPDLSSCVQQNYIHILRNSSSFILAYPLNAPIVSVSIPLENVYAIVDVHSAPQISEA